MSAAQTDVARRRPVRWLVLLLVVVLGIGVLGWVVFGRHTVHVGDRFADRSVTDYDAQRRVHVQIPLAQLNLMVSHGDAVGSGDDEVEAPDGAAMVQVSWTPTRLGLPPVWPAASPRQRADPGADLFLVTGGQRYRLASRVRAGDAGSSTVVVVKGDAASTRIEARYAGRTVHAASGDAELRNPSPSSQCADPSERRHPGRVFFNVSCVLPLHRSVYVAGLGAAPAGKEWLVLFSAGVVRSEGDATVYPPGSDAEGARYVASGAPTVAVSAQGVTGEPKLAGKDVVVGDSVQLADRAWLVPEGKASAIHLRYRLPMALDRDRTKLPDQPARRDIDLRGTATFPAG
ncbi:hypothetical protein [Flexivirga sp. B27]